MNDRFTGQDLAGESDAAQPSRQVQRAAAVATFGGHRLPCIQAHANAERDHRVSVDAFAESALQFDRGPNRLASGREDAEGLVAAELEQRTAVRRNGVPRQLREPGREVRGCLVAALVREPGVPADVGDQEGAQIRGVAHGRTHTRIELHANESRATFAARAYARDPRGPRFESARRLPTLAQQVGGFRLSPAFMLPSGQRTGNASAHVRRSDIELSTDIPEMARRGGEDA
jgi:hypothetical protein